MARNTWPIGASVTFRPNRGSVRRAVAPASALRNGGNSDWLTAGGSATGVGRWLLAACLSVSSIRFWVERSLAG